MVTGKKGGFASSAEKVRKRLLGISIPRDELAVRIGMAACGITVDLSKVTATEALDHFDAIALTDPNAAPMGEQFRRCADAAVLYFHERINAATAPH